MNSGSRTAMEENAESPRELLTVEMVMDLLKCSRRTVFRLRKEGVIKPYRFPGRGRGRLYFLRSQIIDALDEADEPSVGK